MNQHEFVTKQINVWGEDYVFDLTDRGFTPVLVLDNKGAVQWKWMVTRESLLPNIHDEPGETDLTNADVSATLNVGGGSSFLPFR